MNVNTHAGGSRSRPPTLALYVIAGALAIGLAALAIPLGNVGFEQSVTIPLIPVAWLLLSPLARLARRRGGA